jgi:neutral ceramidase
LAREGDIDDDFPPADPQYPKDRALGPLQNVVKSLFDLDAPRVLPLAAVRIGKTLFAGLPGEPTITTAHNIERVLGSADADTVVVLPCTSDYSGYFATPPEYSVQHYEGASTLWGRNSAPFLQAQMKSLLSKPPVPAGAATIEFTSRDDKRRFVATDHISAGTNPDPRLSMTGAVVHVRWSMPEKARVVFANGWWARVEREASGQWAPVIHAGRQLDDVNYPIRIQRDPGWIIDFDRTEQWNLEFTLPAGLTPGRYRVVVAPRDGFAGFNLEFTVT